MNTNLEKLIQPITLMVKVVLPFVLLIISAANADAQSPTDKDDVSHGRGNTIHHESKASHHGFTFPDQYSHHNAWAMGLGLGGAVFQFDCQLEACAGGPALSLDGHIAFFAFPQLAIGLDVFSFWDRARHQEASQTVVVGLTSLAIKYWPVPDFWMKMGFGIASSVRSMKNNGRSSDFNNGIGFTFGLGYEMFHFRTFVVDLGLRIFSHVYPSKNRNWKQSFRLSWLQS